MLIRCRTGGEMIEVPDGQDPHAALDATGCSHCALGLNADPDHHCGENANACPQDHDGTCFGAGETDQERALPRPDGCTTCRPIIHLVGHTALTLGG